MPQSEQLDVLSWRSKLILCLATTANEGLLTHPSTAKNSHTLDGHVGEAMCEMERWSYIRAEGKIEESSENEYIGKNDFVYFA